MNFSIKKLLNWLVAFPQSNRQKNSISIALTANASSNTRKQRGIDGEEYVAQWLQNNGHKIVARNYRTRTGEIDIISTKNNVVAFVEVKLRMHHYFDPSLLVNYTKQRKIIKTAQHYICTHYPAVDKIFRFDVALVEMVDNKPKISYIENAFTSQ